MRFQAIRKRNDDPSPRRPVVTREVDRSFCFYYSKLKRAKRAAQTTPTGVARVDGYSGRAGACARSSRAAPRSKSNHVRFLFRFWCEVSHRTPARARCGETSTGRVCSRVARCPPPRQVASTTLTWAGACRLPPPNNRSDSRL